jgi:hypothetical protein
MRRTVWKYDLPLADEFTITIPTAHKVVHIGPDANDVICMWVEVDAEVDVHNFTFHVEGTGHQLRPWCVHQGTWVAAPYVWHLYEDTRLRTALDLSV